MKRFDISEYVVGIFTILMIAGQIISGVLLGWLADTKGTKSALIICGTSLMLAIAIAWLAQSVNWFYFVFLFFGVDVGAETAMRYNFAVECAPEGERPMYVGLMNAWFAPIYIITPFAGWLSASYGYNFVFVNLNNNWHCWYCSFGSHAKSACEETCAFLEITLHFSKRIFLFNYRSLQCTRNV